MSLLSRLFGKSDTPQATPEGEDYKDFKVFAQPIREGASFRLSARITGIVDGATQEHVLIRADTFQNEDAAIEASRLKAHQMIDQMGARLFD